MSTGTYGLATGVRNSANGGETIFGLSSAQKRTGMQLLGNAAEEETRRNIKNDQLEQERKAGNSQLGSTVGSAAGMAIGASYGSAGGPWGALIGGAIGAIAGHYF